MSSAGSVYSIIGKGVGAAALAIFIFIVEPSNSATCPNFSHYHDVPDAEIDGRTTNAELRRVARIDKYITPKELAGAMTCAEEKSRAVMLQAFGGEPFVADADLYQFAFSGYAYGRVFINKSHHDNYLAEKAELGLRVVKVTFDFDAAGDVEVGDIFLYRLAQEGLSFAEYKDGELKQTDRCLECHKTDTRHGLFFKSRFTGYRTTITPK